MHDTRQAPSPASSHILSDAYTTEEAHPISPAPSNTGTATRLAGNMASGSSVPYSSLPIPGTPPLETANFDSDAECSSPGPLPAPPPPSPQSPSKTDGVCLNSDLPPGGSASPHTPHVLPRSIWFENHDERTVSNGRLSEPHPLSTSPPPYLAIDEPDLLSEIDPLLHPTEPLIPSEPKNAEGTDSGSSSDKPYPYPMPSSPLSSQARKSAMDLSGDIPTENHPLHSPELPVLRPVDRETDPLRADLNRMFESDSLSSGAPLPTQVTQKERFLDGDIMPEDDLLGSIPKRVSPHPTEPETDIDCAEMNHRPDFVSSNPSSTINPVQPDGDDMDLDTNDILGDNSPHSSSEQSSPYSAGLYTDTEHTDINDKLFGPDLFSPPRPRPPPTQPENDLPYISPERTSPHPTEPEADTEPVGVNDTPVAPDLFSPIPPPAHPTQTSGVDMDLDNNILPKDDPPRSPGFPLPPMEPETGAGDADSNNQSFRPNYFPPSLPPSADATRSDEDGIDLDGKILHKNQSPHSSPKQPLPYLAECETDAGLNDQPFGLDPTPSAHPTQFDKDRMDLDDEILPQNHSPRPPSERLSTDLESDARPTDPNHSSFSVPSGSLPIDDPSRHPDAAGQSSGSQTPFQNAHMSALERYRYLIIHLGF